MNLNTIIGGSTLKAYPSSFDSGLLNGAPVALVASNIRGFSDFIGWSRAQGSDVIVLDQQNLKPFLEFRKDLVLVMVDLDDCELEDALDDLADIRERHPHLAIILTSSILGRDDFSLSRLSVCDVSLKLPLRISKLDLAVVLALENNIEWQRRQASSGTVRKGAHVNIL
ncbi:hypothetical protein NNA36_11870 [Shimia sp. CNT1-13L.2]|uniref:hypothetical protein n=1 Tax=Shimia sp. CNT1-13L.2 TaxID=2959663 RepID=UPI0020CD2108|nr:hypothetical protein [Shimia sp. CNT1-13L.2]MCP9482659.1 hypothetical protein [Shimia sp. CNT1-13L.2]